MDEIKLKKGDTVQVIAGKEKGKTGKIVKILREEGRVVVEKLNFVKRHKRPDTRGKGGIMEKEALWIYPTWLISAVVATRP